MAYIRLRTNNTTLPELTEDVSCQLGVVSAYECLPKTVKRGNTAKMSENSLKHSKTSAQHAPGLTKSKFR